MAYCSGVGLNDTYSPWLGTGAQVAQDEKEIREIKSQIPTGSLADQQRLAAASGADRDQDPLDKKDKKGR